jgi:NDP-sugar pyrophosphorylase family protein
MNKKLTAVVLAGGAASRFWPFTASKTLFPFFGKSLFDFSVLSSLPKEVDNVVIISNSDNKEALERFTLDKPLLTVLQQNPLGMADAILSAASELRDCQLLIIIGDDVYDPSLLSHVLSVAKTKKDAFAVLPGWKTPGYFPGGYLRVDNDRILGIVEKPAPDAVPSPYVAISGHYIADSNIFLDELKRAKSETDDAYEQTLTMLALREKVYFTPYTGSFSSLKYPWNVLDTLSVLFDTQFKSRKGKNVQIKSNVVIEGEVYFGDNVKVFENTKIIGPCYIGENTIIGNNNIIRESHIGKNCVTGFNTDITRSYVGDNCWFHSNYIGDSILMNDISMGGGAKLANLRLDDGDISSTVKHVRMSTGRTKLGAMIGSGVRIGVNTSIMPGVKIGSGSYVGSGVTLDQDIAEKSFVALNKNSYTVTTNTKEHSTPRDEFKKLL